jgi:hypothetical protein
MNFRTIAASAAIALGLLAAVPGTAMASTAGSGPTPVQVRCPPKGVQGGGPVTKVACCANAVVRKRGGPVAKVACCANAVVSKHGGLVTSIACCARLVRSGPPPGPGVGPVPIATPVAARVAACGGQSMTFDMPAYSSTATEVSGPRLTAHELVIYKQRLFIIRSVHGRSFTLTQLLNRLKKPAQPVRILKLALFTNGATAITDGHAIVLRGQFSIVVAIKRVPLSPGWRY